VGSSFSESTLGPLKSTLVKELGINSRSRCRLRNLHLTDPPDARYGTLSSATSVVNMFLPIIGGYFVYASSLSVSHPNSHNPIQRLLPPGIQHALLRLYGICRCHRIGGWGVPSIFQPSPRRTPANGVRQHHHRDHSSEDILALVQRPSTLLLIPPPITKAKICAGPRICPRARHQLGKSNRARRKSHGRPDESSRLNLVVGALGEWVLVELELRLTLLG
jgi:hypothetical protein